MSILIKGMEMPKNCYECYLWDYGYCALSDRIVADAMKRADFCPLIEVPKHGRLIIEDGEIVNE